MTGPARRGTVVGGTGRPVWVWRGRFLALRADRRAVLVAAGLVALALAIGLVCLAVGDYPLGAGRVIRVLVGAEHGFARTVVFEWRAPRVVAALAFGAALGVAGAIFQSLTRNPLASPDVVGFATGSYTGALIVIIWIGNAYAGVALGALVGGVATAAAVWLLALRHGSQSFRFIIVGIAVAAMLSSANAWLLLVADHDLATTAAIWGAGSLHAIGWPQTGPACAAISALLIAAAVLSPGLRQLELGDDAAVALGVRVERTRGLAVLVGVGLTAAVTAAAGPIAFVALCAPQIGRRLARGAGVPLVAAALSGALLLLAADAVGQHLLPTDVPVGIVTVVLGGGYLIWLLAAEARRRL